MEVAVLMLSSRAGDQAWIQTETTAELITVGLQTSGRPDATDGPPLHGDRHALGKTSLRPPSGAGGPTGALLAARLGTGAAVGSGRPAGALIRPRLIRSQRPKKPVRVEFGYRGHHHTERPRLGHRTGQQPAGILVAAPKIVGQRNIAQCDSAGTSSSASATRDRTMRTPVCTPSTAQRCCHCMPTALDSAQHRSPAAIIRPAGPRRHAWNKEIAVGDVPGVADCRRDETGAPPRRDGVAGRQDRVAGPGMQAPEIDSGWTSIRLREVARRPHTTPVSDPGVRAG